MGIVVDIVPVATLLVVCCLTTCLVGAGPAKLPSNFKRCATKDPGFQKCIGKAAEDAVAKLRNGAPSLQFSPMDPLAITQLALGKGNGPVSVDLTLNNVLLYGISDSVVTDQNANIEGGVLEATTLTPVLRLEADYILEGKVLLLPIVGNGKCNITLTELVSNIKLVTQDFKKDGQEYMNVTSFQYLMNPKKLRLKLDNLFRGDKALSDNMNIFLNENWPEILKEIKPAIEEGLSQVFQNLSNRIFNKVPKNQIFPETL